MGWWVGWGWRTSCVLLWSQPNWIPHYCTPFPSGLLNFAHIASISDTPHVATTCWQHIHPSRPIANRTLSSKPLLTPSARVASAAHSAKFGPLLPGSHLCGGSGKTYLASFSRPQAFGDRTSASIASLPTLASSIIDIRQIFVKWTKITCSLPWEKNQWTLDGLESHRIKLKFKLSEF